jgi:PqqD family protein of HPr-rel-A system
MSKRPRLENLAVSGTGVVFDPTSGATFTLNASGLVILNALREGLSLDETVARLQNRFEVGGGDAKGEVLDFVARLRRLGIVPTDFRLSSEASAPASRAR